MSEVRRMKLEKLYNEKESSTVDVTVIKTVEKDVRTVLDFLDTSYVGPEVGKAMKRLRGWVGQ